MNVCAYVCVCFRPYGGISSVCVCVCVRCSRVRFVAALRRERSVVGCAIDYVVENNR